MGTKLLKKKSWEKITKKKKKQENTIPKEILDHSINSQINTVCEN